MYAIVECGGRQYRAEEGQAFSVEKLPYEVGEQIELDNVLLLSNDGEITIGQPTINGVTVLATVTKQYRGKKIFVWKYKPKKRYRRRRGHRQSYTRLIIDSIVLGGSKSTPKAVSAPQGIDATADLTLVEGIGPKIQSTLRAGGIPTLVALSTATIEQLQGVLSSAGVSATPDTWPEQAALAVSGDMDALEALQDELVGGRRV